MSQQVELIERACAGCGIKFKVSVGSKTVYHNFKCGQERQWADQPKTSNDGAHTTVSVSEKNITKTQSSDKKNYVGAIQASWPLKYSRKNVPATEPITKPTRSEKMPSELITAADTAPKQEPVANGGETKTLSNVEPVKLTAETVVTRRASSEELPALLQRAALGSLMRLRQSQMKLLALMQESVRDLDLEKSEEGVSRVPLERIEMAIKCANALAHHTQVGVNMLKAVSDFSDANK
jgi:hypothetical protein